MKYINGKKYILKSFVKGLMNLIEEGNISVIKVITSLVSTENNGCEWDMHVLEFIRNLYLLEPSAHLDCVRS